MASRLAACEACRKSKLACDHKRPVCTRCRNANRAALCVYRATPFKRKRAEQSSPIPVQSVSLSPDPSPSFSPRRTPYPNPGYLGSSSHVAIFNQISPDRDHRSDEPCPDRPFQTEGDDVLIRQCADALRHLLSTFPLDELTNLVSFWNAKGVNLALAEPFVKPCMDTMAGLLSTLSDENWHLIYARRWLQNSARPLRFSQTSTIDSFAAQFIHRNARWETVGIFFSAVSRATMDVPFFPPLYSSEKQQYALRRLATKLSDQALEISLSLDCLNDLQLMLQYENFIVHSHVDGDQSYHSWRRLGDGIASIYALGYHENVESKPDTPPFLKTLRQAVAARLYSADKNVAIFLGRPPRMSKRFYHFELSDWKFGRDAKPSYIAETYWSASCALLKEDIMEISRDGKSNANIQKANIIQKQAKAQWQSLPPQFQLNGSLKQCHRSPFELDFIASVRLNHLHVLFLLRLLLLDSPAEPDVCIMEVAQQMLSLIVETILLRDQLVNSGTGLIWKVNYYGLPAAGIILLAMLRERDALSTARISWTKTLQDLTVFVAEVEVGTIIRPGDPNYALLSKATQTIQKFLDSVHSEMAPHAGSADWTAVLGQDAWDFEFAFWENLADHPLLDPLPDI
ncbi:hypothetical protein MW887_004061 [Aspergillus wentii]|nr:hypothetical protein MW887_004061 [Aspergillus wentii]